MLFKRHNSLTSLIQFHVEKGKWIRQHLLVKMSQLKAVRDTSLVNHNSDSLTKEVAVACLTVGLINGIKEGLHHL